MKNCPVDLKRVKYYYLRDELDKPRVTVCVIKGDDGKISRGLSLCSFLDNPCKKEGRQKAYGRALKAFFNRQSYDLLEDNLFAEDVLGSVCNWWSDYNAKSEFDVTPTELETKLFTSRSERA